MLNQGELSTDDPAWVDGWADWGTLGDVPNLKASCTGESWR